MTPQSPFRDAVARRDAIRIYRLAADRMDSLERVLTDDEEREAVHLCGLISMKALRADRDDPDPSVDPWCHCIGCEAYLTKPSVMKLVPLDEAML